MGQTSLTAIPGKTVKGQVEVVEKETVAPRQVSMPLTFKVEVTAQPLLVGTR